MERDLASALVAVRQTGHAHIEAIMGTRGPVYTYSLDVGTVATSINVHAVDAHVRELLLDDAAVFVSHVTLNHKTLTLHIEFDRTLAPAVIPRQALGEWD